MQAREANAASRLQYQLWYWKQGRHMKAQHRYPHCVFVFISFLKPPGKVSFSKWLHEAYIGYTYTLIIGYYLTKKVVLVLVFIHQRSSGRNVLCGLSHS